MKKLLIGLLLLALVDTNLIGQIYCPMPDSNTVWSVNTYKFLIKGDSVYNTKTYKKYFLTNDTALSAASLQYLCMVRQDVANKRVYAITPYTTIERLVYDFTLITNDTITVYPIDIICSGNPVKIKITGKDSVLISGNYRKRFYIKDYYNNGFDTLIEGIGSYCGPLAPDLNLYCVTDVCIPILMCQKQNGVLMFQNSTYSTCYYEPCPLGINQLSAEHWRVTVFPNPTNGLFTLMTNSTDKQNVDFYDVNGRHVFSKNIIGTAEFDANTLDNGIYTLTIKNGVSTSNKKLVIVH